MAQHDLPAPRLALLLVVSLLIHLLLLWSGRVPPAAQPQMPPLHLQLEAPPAAAAAAPQASAAPSPQAAQRHATPAAPSSRAPAAATPPQATVALPALNLLGGYERRAGNSARFGQGQALELPQDPLQSDLLELLRNRLAPHLHYPALAQRSGWQGEVVVTFRIESDGTLSDIALLRGSGFALLDQAALDALQTLASLQLPAGALPQSLEVQMPLLYQLAQPRSGADE